jgi:hypothetical protein
LEAECWSQKLLHVALRMGSGETINELQIRQVSSNFISQCTVVAYLTERFLL